MGTIATRRVALGVAAAFAAALVVVATAGCGSSGSSSATATTAAESWAGGLCTAVNSYTDSLKAVTGTVSDEDLSRAALQSTAKDVEAATRTFVSDLKSLGSKETAASTEAGSIVESLATDLSKDAETIKAATADVSDANGVLSAVSIVSGALVAAKNHVTAAVDQLKQLDPKGELEQAFKSADSCSSLTGS